MPYHRPTDLTAALQLAAQADVKIVAGGTDIFPAVRQGHRPDNVLDVTRISGFSGITQSAGGVRFDAAVRWSQIVNAKLPPAYDALRQSAREVGGVQIQNAGTLAGNLCNASPAADGVPPLLALNATVEIASAARGKRSLPLSEFLTGVRKTALGPDELVTAISVPPISSRAGSAFEKLGSRRYLVISITMCAAVIECDAEGRITDARIAVGACSPVAQRLPALEHDLLGKRVKDITVTAQHLTPLSPIEDVRGSAEYRLDVVAEQCARAIKRAAGHE